MNFTDSLTALLRALLDDRSTQRLGWTLLHFLWQGAAVAALLAVTLLAMWRRSPQARHAASLVALLLMAALPVLTFLLVATSQREPDAEQTSATVEVAAPAMPRTIDIAPKPLDQAEAATQLHPAPQLKDRLQPLLPWLVYTWLLGVAVLSVWHFAGWLRVQRLKHAHTRPLDALWERRFAALCQKLRMTYPVRLLESALVEVTTVAGWLRPVVLVPAAALSGLPAHELEAILAHELAHIRRHDYLVNVAQAVIETLLFYHPAVWWVSAQVRRECEDCCDDEAAGACGAIAYARALASLDELRAACNPPRPALAVTGSPLLRRVRRLVGAPAAGPGSPIGFVAFAVLAAALACTPAATPDADPRDVPAPAGKLSVLLVTQDNYFLARAVNALNVDAKMIEPDELPLHQGAKFDVIIYDRVFPERYPANGKFICIGPMIPRGLTLKEVHKNPPDGLKLPDHPLRAESVTVTKWDKEHEILCNLELNKVFIQSMSRIAPGRGTEVLAEAGTGPATPAIVLHREDGRTFLILPFNVNDTNWPLKVSFPLFLHQAVDYLSAADVKR